MNPPRLYVDFNELVEDDLVLLSKDDTKIDTAGRTVHLAEGLRVDIYMDDQDIDGRDDNLIASGVVERNHFGGWTSAAKWCCRINADGICHESDLRKRDEGR